MCNLAQEIIKLNKFQATFRVNILVKTWHTNKAVNSFFVSIQQSRLVKLMIKSQQGFKSSAKAPHDDVPKLITVSF